LAVTTEVTSGNRAITVKGLNMCERQTTIVCIFDPKIPRITAYHIHEWIHEKLKLLENEVRMVHTTQGQLDYTHDNGELSIVHIERAGTGVRRVRVAKLPPELQDRKLRDVISRYGEVRAIMEEQWSRGYRYPVHNGIRIVEMDLKKHIPSHMTIVGTRALISYEGQPTTCYGCNEPGHHTRNVPAGKQRSPLPP